jgi:hypothetical protein
MVYTKYNLVKHKYVKHSVKVTVYVPAKYVKIPTPPKPIASSFENWNKVKNGMTLDQVQQLNWQRL